MASDPGTRALPTRYHRRWGYLGIAGRDLIIYGWAVSFSLRVALLPFSSALWEPGFGRVKLGLSENALVCIGTHGEVSMIAESVLG